MTFFFEVLRSRFALCTLYQALASGNGEGLFVHFHYLNIYSLIICLLNNLKLPLKQYHFS